MRWRDGRWQLVATDLAGHVGCAHRTQLARAHADGTGAGPPSFDPVLELLAERGRAHEDAYRAHLEAAGRTILRVGDLAATRAAIVAGVDVIAQAHLASGAWHGVADFLVRVDAPSALGPWSYEIHEAKLATETRAGAVLQLCGYAALLAEVQGCAPPRLRIVAPSDGAEPFRFDDHRFDEYAAVYRLLRADLEAAVAAPVATYPEPCAACDTCAWFRACDARWRQDDHLALVAGAGRPHRRELRARRIETVGALAAEPRPLAWRPAHGSAGVYEGLAHQAALQVAARVVPAPPVERLPVEPGRGLARLPPPDTGDVFLDLEGDPFIGPRGQEYLFGWVAWDDGAWRYHARWADDAAGERGAVAAWFDWLEARLARHPELHVYHFAPYEPAALRRLVGATGLGTVLMDRLLREQRFVDLMTVARQGLRVGVESYGLKPLEAVTGYARAVPLEEARVHLRRVCALLQRGDAGAIQDAWRAGVAGYNEDDCRSALALRDYLEQQRAAWIDAGVDVPRPVVEVKARTEEAEGMRAELTACETRLLARAAAEGEGSDAAVALARMADLVAWYQREDAIVWGEFFRRADSDEDQRFDDPKSLAGLELVDTLPREGKERLVRERYRYPAQDVLIEQGADLFTDAITQVGRVASIDADARTIVVTRKDPGVGPLTSLVSRTMVKAKPKDRELLRIGQALAEDGVPADLAPSLVRDLLLARPPRCVSVFAGSLVRAGESPAAAVTRIALGMRGAVLPIQGPPGTGKTTTAAAMILALVRAGRKVGVTATSHAVIEQLVARVVEQAHRDGGRVPRAALRSDGPPRDDGIELLAAKVADARIAQLDLLGATAWQWARPAMAGKLDVLVVDEAGQMSLADALAVSAAADSLVLVGDPQQLEQPIAGSHPDGAAVSALEHMLGGRPTIAADRGVLLDESFRLHPRLCAFTSEQYYEGRLRAAAGTEGNRLSVPGVPALEACGAFWLPVEHDARRGRCAEEAEAIAALIERILDGAPRWTERDGAWRPLGPDQIAVMAAYNAQVDLVARALAARRLRDVRVSTVDRFQGREAAIAMYSMAVSRPEDAPRGMDFLYSRNRLNVATSRGKCAVVVAASGRLLKPECKTPAQLRLASGLCRWVEVAGRVGRGDGGARIVGHGPA